MDRRGAALLLLSVGLVGFVVIGSSSGLIRPAAWRPGSVAGQRGPDGSTWLGIGDEARHRDLSARVTGIEDQRCRVECVAMGEVRVQVDVSIDATESRRVVLVHGTRSASEVEVGPCRIRVVDVTAQARVPFAWQGVALLITDLPAGHEASSIGRHRSGRQALL